MTPSYLLFRQEPIVVARWHVHCELSSVSALWHRLRDASDVVDEYDTLDFFVVDVDDSAVGDCDHALLRPPIHVNFLHHRGVYKGVSSNELHEGVMSAEIDVVFLSGEPHWCCLCLNHFVSLYARLCVLLFTLFFNNLNSVYWI